jgi:RHS repeat-associated protein
LDQRVYDPYGTQHETLAPAALETKGWIGQRFDADAALQYLNARYYDPELAMFIQPDWWEVTKPGVGTNRYAYSAGDPINLSDPGGNQALPKPSPPSSPQPANINRAPLDTRTQENTRTQANAPSRGTGFYVIGLLTGLIAVTAENYRESKKGVVLTPAEVGAGFKRDPNTGEITDKDGIVVNARWGGFSKAVQELGRAKPGQQVHHVIEVESGYPASHELQALLADVALNPNDPRFGIGLNNHSGRHPKNYARAVRSRLEGLKTKEGITKEIESIRDEIADVDGEIDRGERLDKTAVGGWTKDQGF